MRRNVLFKGLLLLLVLVTFPAQAQYGVDPAKRPDKPGNIYFGSVKSTDGNYLKGATVVLETEMVNHVNVTDEKGRYRFRLPLDVLPADVTPRCSKPGYKLKKINKRLPSRGENSPVEYDFVLEVDNTADSGNHQ